MRKTGFILLFILCCLTFMIGCTNNESSTIAYNEDSEYKKTFDDLHLGILLDYDFKLIDADDRWVTLWVEEYINGAMAQPEPLLQLAYGKAPTDNEEGNLGLGIVDNTNAEGPFMFLYGPSVTGSITEVESQLGTDVLSGWDQALGDEKVELLVGEELLLAAYRETKGDSISMVDLTNKEDVNRILEEDDRVLLFKIQVDEEITGEGVDNES